MQAAIFLSVCLGLTGGLRVAPHVHKFDSSSLHLVHASSLNPLVANFPPLLRVAGERHHPLFAVPGISCYCSPVFGVIIIYSYPPMNVRKVGFSSQ